MPAIPARYVVVPRLVRVLNAVLGVNHPVEAMRFCECGLASERERDWRFGHSELSLDKGKQRPIGSSSVHLASKTGRSCEEFQ